jgi:aspartate kinase
MSRPLKVAKFGGTSVGAPESLKGVVEIVKNSASRHRMVVIASAVSGVTDLLVNACNSYDESYDKNTFLNSLHDRHVTLASAVLQPESLDRYLPVLEAVLASLDEVMGDLRTPGKEAWCRDAVIAAGERMSVPLVALALIDAGLDAIPVDSAPLVVTDDTYGEAIVDLSTTKRNIQDWHQNIPEKTIPVVTGFIGSTPDGHTTTLGRGGSDYSAALFASALHAVVMERWTDVDGIYAEDPRKNKHAKRLASIVLEEAWAWNQAGRLGMHRKALDPLVSEGIPVHVRCTLTPHRFGTLIVPAGREQAISAVAL